MSDSSGQMNRQTGGRAGSRHLKSSSKDLETVHILLQQPSCLSAMFSLSAPSSSGSPAHDQISPSISRYLAADGLPAWPDSFSSPAPLLPWLLRTEETQASDPRFEPQQTPQSSGTRKKASLPFKAAGLSLVYKYMRYKLYIYIPSEGQSVPWGKMKSAGKVEEKIINEIVGV